MNLPKIYGFIDISEVDVILKTCKSIEIPPNPSKKLHTIIFIDIDFIGIFEARDTPFVSSTMPEKIAFPNESGMFNTERIGLIKNDKNLKAPILLRIDIITLNSTTNPPIITTVLIEDIILF